MFLGCNNTTRGGGVVRGYTLRTSEKGKLKAVSYMGALEVYKET